jgi:hypothetical protein
MKEEALAEYRHAILAWCAKTAFSGGKNKPPELPDILKD